MSIRTKLMYHVNSAVQPITCRWSKK